jgi:hypothetical protein
LCFVKKEEHFKADIISILKEVKKSILKEWKIIKMAYNISCLRYIIPIIF